MAVNADMREELDAPYLLVEEHVVRFREDGFLKLKNVFSPDVLAYYGQEVTRLTLARNPLHGVPMEQRDTYAKAFIQVINLWRENDVAKAFSFSRRLAGIATALLGTDGVRMYHDQALYKEAGGGPTPWHVDQQYWPLSSARSITAWVPLQAVPAEMGPLAFGKGSHRKNIGRELAISDESERTIRAQVREHGVVEVCEPFALGEVSFHLGWTLHRAGGNTTDQARKVHTVIYIDKDMRFAAPKNPNQQRDWEQHSPGTRIGEVMADELNPVLYERNASPTV